MKEQKPEQGGIAAVLQLIAILEVVGAFLGGALANFTLGAEIVLIVSAFVIASLLWGAGVVIQELRNISFNTRRSPEVASVARVETPSPAPPLDENAAMQAYGIKREGKRYRFGEYLYDNLRDAVNYASRQPSA